MTALHRGSRGVPRLVNLLAHKSLLLVFGEGGHAVLGRHIRAAVRDTPATRAPRSRWWLSAAPALAPCYSVPSTKIGSEATRDTAA